MAITKRQKQLLATQIENVAAEVLTAKGTKREILQIKKTNLLLTYKDLASFAGNQNVKELMEASPKGKFYSGVIFGAAFMYAEEHYGEKDKASNTLIPYLKHFNWCLKLKEAAFKIEKQEEQNGFNQDARAAAVRAIIYKLGEKYGIPVTSQDIDFNPMNSARRTEFLLEMGFDEKAIKDVNIVAESNFICGMEAGNEEEDSDAWMSDKDDYKAFRHGEMMMDKLADRLERNERLLQNSPTAMELLRMVVTMCYAEYEESVPGLHSYALLERYLDKPMLRYIHLHPEAKDVIQNVANYRGIKRETLLKKITKIQNMLVA